MENANANRNCLNPDSPDFQDFPDFITHKIIGCAMKVHKTLGNGFHYLDKPIPRNRENKNNRH